MTQPTRIVVVNGGSRKAPEIQAIVAQLGGEAGEVLLADANAHDFTPYDGVILSGGPHLYTDPERGPAVLAQFAFLDALDKPTLGICLGHQAIALRRGGAVYRGEACRQPTTIQIVAEHPLVVGLGPQVVMGEDHCEGVELPPGFALLARSAVYAVEAMAAVDRPLFGVQFHPEISGDAGLQLFRNFLGIVRAEGQRP